MLPRKHKTPWWQLYLGLALLCSLLAFEIDLHLDGTYDTVLQLTILGFIFLFTRAWLHANPGALMQMDENAPERKEQWGVRIYQSPAAESVAGARSRTASMPFLDLPAGEVKGVLSTTFEVEGQQGGHVYDVPRIPLPEELLGTKAHASGKE